MQMTEFDTTLRANCAAQSVFVFPTSVPYSSFLSDTRMRPTDRGLWARYNGEQILLPAIRLGQAYNVLDLAHELGHFYGWTTKTSLDPIRKTPRKCLVQYKVVAEEIAAWLFAFEIARLEGYQVSATERQRAGFYLSTYVKSRRSSFRRCILRGGLPVLVGISLRARNYMKLIRPSVAIRVRAYLESRTNHNPEMKPCVIL